MTLGYSIIVGITLFFLLLFLKKNRIKCLFEITQKLLLFFLIVLIFVSITISVYKLSA